MKGIIFPYVSMLENQHRNIQFNNAIFHTSKYVSSHDN